ncbi:MAG: VTT domain-containing protein [Polyangiaceae bacterium]
MDAPNAGDGTAQAPNKTLRNLRIGAVAFVASGLLLAQRLGVFHVFTDPARIKTALLDMGPWGYLTFIVAYACLQPFGVPGTVFIVAAPLIWSWPVAFVLSMIGTMAASVVGFSFARFVARDWLSRLVPARFHAYDAALAKRAFGTVVLLRFIFWMPPMLHIFFGVSRVRFWTHFWGSFIGYLVPLFLTAYFGQRLFDYMKSAPPTFWIGMVGVFALGWITYFLVRRRRAAAKAEPLHEDRA